MKQLSFAFPFLKKGQGKSNAPIRFTDEHQIYKLLAGHEPSGNYLVSNHGMWHGGIHITEAGIGTRLDLEQGVRCIADGHIIAYRINRAYPVSELPATNGGAPVQLSYSTGFALVRHTMEFSKGSTLTFYSLYMHLQAYEDYERDTSRLKPAYWPVTRKVTEHAQDKPRAGRNGQAPEAGQRGLNVRASAPKGRRGHVLAILPQGTQVSIGEKRGNWGKVKDTHGARLYAPQVGDVTPSTAVGGWIFLGNEHGGPVVQEVMSDDVFDHVAVIASVSGNAGDANIQGLPVKAGELIGHLGRYDPLNSGASPTRMAHIEVFCDDSIKTFIDKGREWIAAHGKDDWAPLGLSAEPTLLRVDKGVKLYQAAEREGADAPKTGVVRCWPLAELARDRNNQHAETTADRSGRKVNWWKVASADARHQPIGGWVREENFAGGRVTREFAQKWVDFSCIADEHDPTHTIFPTTREWVDYSRHADVPDMKSETKLSPLMKKVYRALFPEGDGHSAADQMCRGSEATTDGYPWLMQTGSRLIVKHESEWANPQKWKKLLTEIEQFEGPKPQYAEEHKRIEKLVWWEQVREAIAGFPSADVFHIHPIGLVGNFAVQAANAISMAGLWFIFSHEAMAGVTNRLHWPGGASGVTLGAGYDMKARSATEVASDMMFLGIDQNTANEISKAAGLSSSQASRFASDNHDLLNLTDDQQVQLLTNTVGRYEATVRNSINVPLRQNEFDALVSFAYNPAGRWGSVSKFVNDGRIDDAMNKVREGNTSGGVVMRGLTNRRTDEVNLFLHDRYEFNGRTLPAR
ncbi:EF hand domain-containing protein [Caballeronia arvi]|uniref:Lysozyme n=1 Tax=Caballeronia arvi TaxID=1777135 RepID=A0A158K5Y4_9BURK|nr:glycoside hydrolase family protein [Caballeronia arvi]SAL76527.1 EF hand domain-containing protein [Caballeronia arvi]